MKERIPTLLKLARRLELFEAARAVIVFASCLGIASVLEKLVWPWVMLPSAIVTGSYLIARSRRNEPPLPPSVPLSVPFHPRGEPLSPEMAKLAEELYQGGKQ